jgi:hypothetical protein
VEIYLTVPHYHIPTFQLNSNVSNKFTAQLNLKLVGIDKFKGPIHFDIGDNKYGVAK